MSGGITVTPEQLRAYSARLSNAATEIETILGQLRAQLGPLQEDWSGAASEAFVELWRKWQRDAAGLEEALTGLAALAVRAATAYESTEEGIASSFPFA